MENKDLENLLNEIKNKHSIGDTMTLRIYRNGSEKDIEVVLQEQ